MLDVEGLRVVDAAGVVQVDDVSFSVREGEIYAIAGVQGNGQTEVTECLVGLETPTAGRISVLGNDITTSSVRDRLDLGIGYVPEDRSHDGLVSSFTVEENLVLDMYESPTYAGRFGLDLAAISANGATRVEEFDVRCREPAGGGEHAVGRKPAKGRAGKGIVAAVEAARSWRSRREVLTSGRWSSCTSASCVSAMSAPRSC